MVIAARVGVEGWAVAAALAEVGLPLALGAFLGLRFGAGRVALGGLLLVALDVAVLHFPLWDVAAAAVLLAAGALLAVRGLSRAEAVALAVGLPLAAGIGEGLGRSLLPPVSRPPVWAAPWQRVDARFPSAQGSDGQHEADACALAYTDPPPPPPGLAVLHLGDSMVYGTGVNPDEALVARIGAVETGIGHVVAAVPGVAPDVLLMAARRHLAAGPWVQVVLYVFSGNDRAEVDFPYACCPGGPLLDAELRPRCSAPVVPGAIEGLLGASPPPIALRVLGELSIVAAHLDARWIGWRGRQAHGFTNPIASERRGLARIVQIGRLFAHEVRSADTLPTIVVLPDRRAAHDAAARANHVELVDALRASGLEPIDALPFLDLTDEASFVDPIHLSASGHEALAHWLGPRLAARRLR